MDAMRQLGEGLENVAAESYKEEGYKYLPLGDDWEEFGATPAAVVPTDTDKIS